MTAEDTIDRFATARYAVREAHEARWVRWIAVFCLQLLILTVVLHRFFGLNTDAAINLIGVCMAGFALAIVVAFLSLIRIWFGGQTGAANDFAAIAVGLIGLAVPAYFVAQAVMLPEMNDVQTSPTDPVQFTVLLENRPPDANPLPGTIPPTAQLQAEAYPDIGPIVVDRPVAAAFAVVNEAVKSLGWEVVASQAPDETGVGRLEAMDHTMIMGFTDDVAVRVKGNDTSAVIDIRSASRNGKHDFGANAARIQAFNEAVNTGLDKAEKTALEHSADQEKKAEEPVAAPAKQVKKKRKRRTRSRTRQRRVYRRR